MDSSLRTIQKNDFPDLLSEITDPPEALFVRGSLPSPETKLLCVVGSRRCSAYGRDACEKLIAGLTGYPVSIISGLALGIDSVAHASALRAGLHTIAVPGSGLGWDVLYPRMHAPLARQILTEGGALVSEFPEDFKATPWSFPQRNRIMAGLAHATLIVEAQERSGTLITARLAMEYNRDVLIVPGSIFSAHTAGSHRLLKDGAAPVAKSADILEILDISAREPAAETASLSDNERKVLAILAEPKTRDELIRELAMPAQKANILLSAMELKGLIVERLGMLRRP